MPEVHLRYQPGLREYVPDLARTLPEIIAPHLDIPNRELHDGSVSPDEIIVFVHEISEFDVNTLDFHVTIFAHDFPERLENAEGRKGRILARLREHFKERELLCYASVSLILNHIEYGRI